MAKKKKKILKDGLVINEKPVKSKVKKLPKLKIDDEVLFEAPYLMDKTKVISVDKEDQTAVLENKVKVSIGINPDGTLTRLGVTTENTKIRIWDDRAKLTYDAYLSNLHIKDMAKILSTHKFSNMDAVTVCHKLHKVLTKFGVKL